jgi:hypothetical protein
MRTFLLLLCLAMPAAATEKSYDLSLESLPRAGQKSRLLETDQLKMTMVANDIQAPPAEERKLFEATERVISADEQGNAELERTYGKAQRLVGGVMTPWGFQGKTVKVTLAKDQPASYAYIDGTEIAAEDLKALQGSFNGAGGKSEETNPLMPPGRMRVGETWNPDIMAVARMFDDEMAKSVDPSKSRASFSLKAVEKRNGIEFAKIEGVIELAMHNMGVLTFDVPLMMRMRVDLDACIDGKVQEGSMKMMMRMRATSGASVEGQRMNIDLDMTANSELSRTPMK